MKLRTLVSAGVVLSGVGVLFAWMALPVADDPLLRMPGTQPAQNVGLEAPDRCFGCHADENMSPPVTIGPDWQGSMMAQSARDPMLFACLTVALQDSIWALGNPNAGDLCMRCHFPEGWLGGRSDPPNASLMGGSDFDGIHCDFCHQLYDPFFEATYNGTREGGDWSGYWDEAGNTGPGSGTLSQDLATTAYTDDVALSADVKLFSGGDFYTKSHVPQYSTYTENGSGQYFVSSGGEKRASFADAAAKHKMRYSRYHKSKYFCATCHDVSNAALANAGLSGLPDQSGGADLVSEQYSAFRYFHVERTFSEFRLSAYGQGTGAATNSEFAALSGGIEAAARCQDCHMYDTVAYGCNKTGPNGAPLRPGGSSEHPHSGMPRHDMTGGNAWITHILGTLDASLPNYDPVNAAILGQGPAVLTLDLTAGRRVTDNGAALLAAAQRARDQLRWAATLKDVDYDYFTGRLEFKVQNNTGHKLISGFPEGRRMFLNIRLYAGAALVHEVNPYDDTAGTLKGRPHAASAPPLGPGESYLDALVYEVHPRSSLTGEEETFHFVLADGRSKDNRIPPKGFDVAAAPTRLSEPVWQGVSAPDYFTVDEYAGGYDEVHVQLPSGVDRVEITLYYQGTSREYIEFLRDEINGVATTLGPSPVDGSPAYIAQTDPFFAQLRAWGDAIWDLWWHNHGLDGSGVAVAGIVPFAMTQATWDASGAAPPCDLDGSGALDMGDMAWLMARWLATPCSSANDDCDGADLNEDGTVDMADFGLFVQCWQAW